MAQSTSMELIQQLIKATQPQNQSLLPNDLQTTSRVLSIMVEVLDANNITNEVYKQLLDAYTHVLNHYVRELAICSIDKIKHGAKTWT